MAKSLLTILPIDIQTQVWKEYFDGVLIHLQNDTTDLADGHGITYSHLVSEKQCASYFRGDIHHSGWHYCSNHMYDNNYAFDGSFVWDEL